MCEDYRQRGTVRAKAEQGSLRTAETRLHVRAHAAIIRPLPWVTTAPTVWLGPDGCFGGNHARSGLQAKCPAVRQHHP